MRRLQKKYIFIAIFAGLLFVGALPSRASELSYSQIPIPFFGGFSNPPTLGELFGFIYGAALLISGIALFSSVFIFGFQFLTSGANPGKRREAQHRFSTAAVGAALLLGTSIILGILNPQLLAIGQKAFGVCYAVPVSELALSPAEQKDKEQNRLAAGLPPNCPPLQLFTLRNNGNPSLGGPTSGSTSTPGAPGAPGTPGTTPPTTTSSTSGSCNVIDPSTDPANPCAYTELQSFGVSNASGSPVVNEIHASQVCNAETGGNPLALNNKCLSAVAGNNTTGAYSVGLFQLNLYAGTGPSGGGRCPGAFSYIDNTTCEIADKNILISCAQQYGVTLQFDAAHPYGTIVGDSVTTELSRAVEIWNGNSQKFCGTWSAASASKCALCPNN